MKLKKADIQSENLIRVYHKANQVCLTMEFVYVLWSDTNAACKKEIFSILSLDFHILLR